MTSQYESTSYFTLDPHAQTGDGSGYIPIDEIASRVYGKSYNSLRGCQLETSNPPNNDSVVLYDFADEGEFEEALAVFDSTEIYLGWDREARQSRVKTGMTQIDYWRSIRVAERPEDVTVEANPPDCMDLEGAVFEDRIFADRSFSPHLRGVIADLIRRGELPPGNYIYRHWW